MDIDVPVEMRLVLSLIMNAHCLRGRSSANIFLLIRQTTGRATFQQKRHTDAPRGRARQGGEDTQVFKGVTLTDNAGSVHRFGR